MIDHCCFFLSAFFYEYERSPKRQYTSLILYHNENQMSEAISNLEEQRVKYSPETIYTEISAPGTYYPAEE